MIMRRARVVIVCGACVVVALVAVAITSSSRGRPQVHERSSRVLRASTAHARATARATGSAVSRLAATTVLGTGRAGSAGARGAGTATELYGPGGIALDAAGDLFVADTGNCRVLEVPATSGTHFGIHMLGGHAYVIAGGSCSTKGPSDATSSSAASSGGTTSTSDIGFVSSVAVDSSGDVFIADPSGNRILELASSNGDHLGVRMRAGKVSVVAGDGSAGDSGDGGPATAAELNGPQGVGVDASGDLYIADTSNCEVREVAARSGTQWGVAMVTGHIYTVAGTPTCGQTGDGGPVAKAELWDPSDVVVGPSGDLLVSDSGGEEVLDMPAVSGSYYGVHVDAGDIAAVAGFGFYGPYLIDGLPGTGETAELNSPGQIALDPAGDLFVTDTYSSCIREVTAVASSQRGLQLKAGDMYTVAGAMSTGPYNQATTWIGPEMLYPVGVAVGPGGTLFYSDQGANEVRVIPAGA